jgi:FixJ family two-component response regulator
MYFARNFTIPVKESDMSESIIYVIDDNQEFRESTTWMLEGAGYSVKEFSDPVLALSTIERNYSNSQGCCLLDIRMPLMSGLEVHDRLLSKNLDIPIIYMTGHGDIPLAVEAMKKGAITFLEKPLNIKLLKKAIGVAFKKSEELKKEQSDLCISDQNRQYIERISMLTDREREVLREIVAGKMNKVIAIDLGISVKTVELHRSRVMSKMKAKTPADLVKMYITESIT